MCGCWCVVVPFILDVRLVDAPEGVTQEECHTGVFLFLILLFYLSSSCDIGKSGMGPAPVFIFAQLTSRDASCVCIPHSCINFI